MNGKISVGLLQVLLVLGISQLAPGNPPLGAAMHGIVTDPTGAVIPHAQVLVAGDGFKQTVETDGTGSYLVAGLPAGEYRVRVHRQGFADYFKSGLVATAGYETQANASLHVRRMHQVVTVSE